MNPDELEQSLQECLRVLSGLAKGKVLLGLSGGLDSVALLHMLVHSNTISTNDIEAVHVNHKLHPHSAEWAEFCFDLCRHYGVSCHVVEIDVTQLKQTRPEQSLEALAREARYTSFKKFLTHEKVLFTAHHADDQVETFFLQLMRGSGPKGLQSMPYSKPFYGTQHIRPLLSASREFLEGYCRDNALQYVNDTSNFDTNFDRNYLRAELLPVLQQRWPGFRRSVSNSIKHIVEEHSFLSELIKTVYPEIFSEERIDLRHLHMLDMDKRSMVLRLWLESFCEQLPPRVRLSEFLRQLAFDNPESKAELSWNGHSLRLYKNCLYFVSEQHRLFDDGVWHALAGRQIENALELPDGTGYLEVKNIPEDADLRIRYRHGGESLRLGQEDFHRKLKHLFNQSAVLPWWRSRIPLLYSDDVLVAVADLWINADWLEQHETHDFAVVWHDRPRILHE